MDAMGKIPSNPAVPKLWPNSTIVCIASGPSLTDADVEFVRGKARVIVVNDNHRKAPWADVLYAADKEWWLEYKGVPTFAGLKYALPDVPGGCNSRVPWPDGVAVLRQAGDFGLELDPSGLKTGGGIIKGRGNSGYQAINLAVHLGASKIVLLGYDMQRGKDGKLHWFGNHPENLKSVALFSEFVKGYPSLLKPLAKLGIEIVNCTRRTALTCFDQQPLEQALSMSVAA